MSRDIASPAQLFDLCQELFGLGGEYDEEAHPDVPFYKIRMAEIGKIKAFVRKRGLEYRSLGYAAHYCHDAGITIRSTGELIPHIGPALVRLRRIRDLETQGDLDVRIGKVMETLMERGEKDRFNEILRMPRPVVKHQIADLEREVGL